MKKEILAYTAGLFDGEGCVDIYKATTSKASKSPSLMLRVNIVQKDGQIMNWLQDNFGGYVALDHHGGYYIHRWEVRSQAAHRFLSSIAPFVIIKKKQLLVALKFEEMKGKYLNSLKGHSGFRQLSKEEINQRMKAKEYLMILKREYTPYISAPTTTKRKDTER